MLRKERLLTIVNSVNQNGFLTVNDLIEKLNVSDMTIRRDLNDLEKSGKIIRIHGGCQSLMHTIHNELAHTEKQGLHQEEKNNIAQIAVSYIEEGDTIFLGTGTTIELFSHYLTLNGLRIVTNSLAVFESLKNNFSQYEVILIGGNYRKKTHAFVGSIANETIRKLRFSKTFIGANGIQNNGIYTSNAEEGQTQRIALNCSQTRYIVADHHKVNKSDFYEFYHLEKVDALITDHTINPDVLKHLENYTKILCQPH